MIAAKWEDRDKLGIKADLKPGQFPGFTARLPGQTTKKICKQLNFATLMLLKKITSSPPSESHPYILKGWLSFSPSPAVTWAINSLSSLWGAALKGLQKGKAAERGREEPKEQGWLSWDWGHTQLCGIWVHWCHLQQEFWCPQLSLDPV